MFARLFTKRFTKDIIFITLFVVSYYALINNPRARPIPEFEPGKWHIALLQHPLAFGIAGHNYLVLVDDTGEKLSELHGLATDPVTNTWKHVGIKKTDLLRVWELDKNAIQDKDKKVPGVIIASGDRGAIAILWSNAEKCKERINNSELHYPPLGVSVNGDTENSNSVAYTLMKCMGIPNTHIGWFTPGSNRDLLKDREVK